ncbi:MAG: acyl-CoA dehydrogenase C-terminal domain-containing protein [Pseudomonadota bacterium]
MANEALASGTADDPAFYETKLMTGRYYMQKLLPETGMRLARIKAGGETVMALPAEAF